uniref:t-SNARE coiled-coil homology domain-containing protein n=1 Tax=Oryza rufipogon TaxID=4529 RepID=A0A0E0N7Y7_ORYRU
MSSAQDPFYIVREEIQDSIDKLQTTFHRWEKTPSNTGEHVHLTKELHTSCESIEWQVDELEKTILVASRDPAYYGLDEVELSRRRNWIGSARNQVAAVRRSVEKGKSNSTFSAHQDMGTSRSSHYTAQDNDDFIASESDRQLLLMRQQDEELDELSESVQRIGGVGLTIHEELSGQERILNDLSLEMETTSNRLDFVQKRVAMVMKKAGIKGQIMLILFLVVLFIILFVLKTKLSATSRTDHGRSPAATVPGFLAEQFRRTWPCEPVSTLICPIFTMDTANWSKNAFSSAANFSTMGLVAASAKRSWSELN